MHTCNVTISLFSSFSLFGADLRMSSHVSIVHVEGRKHRKNEQRERERGEREGGERTKKEREREEERGERYIYIKKEERTEKRKAKKKKR